MYAYARFGAQRGGVGMICRQKLVIPTYEMDEAERSPYFYDVRIIRGHGGTFIPFP